MIRKLANGEQNLMNRLESLILSIKEANSLITEEGIALALGYNEGYIAQCRSRKTASTKFINQLEAYLERLQNAKVEVADTGDVPMNAIHALAESTNKLSDSNLINAKNIERLISLLERGFEQFGLGSKLEENQKYFEAREGVNPSPFGKFGDGKKS